MVSAAGGADVGGTEMGAGGAVVAGAGIDDAESTPVFTLGGGGPHGPGVGADGADNGRGTAGSTPTGIGGNAAPHDAAGGGAAGGGAGGVNDGGGVEGICGDACGAGRGGSGGSGDATLWGVCVYGMSTLKACADGMVIAGGGGGGGTGMPSGKASR